MLNRYEPSTPSNTTFGTAPSHIDHTDSSELTAAAWHEKPMRYRASDFTISTVRNDPDRSGDLWRALYTDPLSDRTLDRRSTDAAISYDLPFTPARALGSEIVPRS